MITRIEVSEGSMLDHILKRGIEAQENLCEVIVCDNFTPEELTQKLYNSSANTSILMSCEYLDETHPIIKNLMIGMKDAKKEFILVHHI